ncbi:MAG: M13 family metallopeptidase [Xanthomonadales bacterium]|nr:M13 family metallopeptidase [Xanthomonadales bacterium]
MRHPLSIALAAALAAGFGLSACQQEAEDAVQATDPGSQQASRSAADVAQAEPAAPLGSGIDTSGFNSEVRAQDDFFEHVNGSWVAETDIPADRARWGSFDRLREQSQHDVRELIEDVSQAEDLQPGTPAQKIRDFYNAYMDVDRVNELGLEPIRGELDAIAAATTHDRILQLMGELGKSGVGAPVGLFVFSDLKDPNTNVLYIGEDGLTLPDRDYYLVDEERYAEGRRLMLEFAEGVYRLAGRDNPAELAQQLLALETRLAEVNWTREENRDPVKIYNPKSFEELQSLAPRVDWAVLMEAAGIPERDMIVVQQPSYFEAMDDIFAETPVETWRDYLTFRMVSSWAPVLGDEAFDLWFSFYQAGLQGIEEPEPLWKRAVNRTNADLGELVGQLYVERHYRQESRARMEEMIGNLVKAYEQSIKGLDWMSEETKQAALTKLAKFNPKIGYPDEWRDYSKLEIREGELVGNIRRAAEFEYQRNLDKLDQPVDKNEWFMTPQTVNAYYNPAWNEIVFPASILQPPFFNVQADDAVNYGGIGAVIGHEIGHGFDDQGRKFDGDGNLQDWWTESDNARFIELKDKLAAQYDSYEVIDGLTINGEFTSGENIGDLGGLGIAYEAYRLSLDGEEAPVIDGFTGDQRFFIGWAQVWRAKARPEEAKRLLTIDPHSPPKFRANGAAVNVDAFYEAFDVQPGDGMYLPPEERVKIW